jgi:hypothetical protein
MASTPRQETLWTLTKGTQTASAVIAHLEGIGIGLRLLWNGDLRQSQVFRTPTAVDDALAEAHARRRDLESRGWSEYQPGPWRDAAPSHPNRTL